MTKAANINNALRVIAANNLSDGVVVYFTGTKWSKNLQFALVSADEAELLSAAQNSVSGENIIGLEPVTVEIQGKTITPTAMREKIRALGPTINFSGSDNRTGTYSNVSI